MDPRKTTVYPTFLQAVHLVVLYIFIQTIVDFPLAVIDYYYGTDYLYLPIKKVLLGVGSVLFILVYGIRKSREKIGKVFPMRFFNPILLVFITTFLIAVQGLISEVNLFIDRYLPAPNWFMELFNNIFESDYGWTGAFIKVVVVAPVVEELIFRGVIMQGFMRNYPKILAILFSALLFALFHLNPWQFPATFILGLLLGWLMVRTHSILLCILTHALNNLIVLLTVIHWDKISLHALSLVEKQDQLTTSALLLSFSIIMILLLSTKKKKQNGLHTNRSST
jgi:uncharacterized protein